MQMVRGCSHIQSMDCFFYKGVWGRPGIRYDHTTKGSVQFFVLGKMYTKFSAIFANKFDFPEFLLFWGYFGSLFIFNCFP